MYFKNLGNDEIVSISYIYELEKEDNENSLCATSLFECTAQMIAYTFRGVSEHAFIGFTDRELWGIFDRCIKKRDEKK